MASNHGTQMGGGRCGKSKGGIIHSATDILEESQLKAASLRSLEAGILLEALAGFIEPIVRTYLRGKSDLHRAHTTHDDQLARDQFGQEGQDLLQSLDKFIAVAVSRYSQDQSKHDIQIPEHVPDGIGGAIPPSLVIQPEPFPSQKLIQKFQEEIRTHVFNQMPVRMLAFNANGNNTQLLERHEVTALITSLASSELCRSEQDGHTTEVLVSQMVEKYSRYAILSHEWIRDIPGDIVYGTWKTGALEKEGRGYSKIKNFCQVAARDHGVVLGWMDTLCINKESSSELDESIRSMYKWYKNSYVCITHLSRTQDLETMHLDSWFTRGWTLQELLAPRRIIFYSQDWSPLVCEVKIGIHGYPSEPSAIDEQIQKATNLTWTELRLYYHYRVDELPISRVMQLAASRNVTRSEDRVYSLMGLLGVEISIAYGEGPQRALFRLMREVLSSSRNNLLDVFNHSYHYSNSSLIPKDISDYTHRWTIFDNLARSWQPFKPILLTHLGVRISLLLVPALKIHARAQHNHQYNPVGSFSGIVKGNVVLGVELFRSSTPTVENLGHLFLLDQSIYRTQSQNLIVTLGIMNFSVRNNVVLFPRTCLSIPLDCHGKVKDVGPSDKIDVISQPNPVVFQFRYKDATTSPIEQKQEPEVEDAEGDAARSRRMLAQVMHEMGERSERSKVPINDLRMHGMEIVTLYL